MDFKNGEEREFWEKAVLSLIQGASVNSTQAGSIYIRATDTADALLQARRNRGEAHLVE